MVAPDPEACMPYPSVPAARVAVDDAIKLLAAALQSPGSDASPSSLTVTV